ncbi:MAG: hypothetical protein F7C34_03065 [Desulfurococcales archaeon]|nr:hypothetical protein [Desulfurococcales archaeon]
MGSRRLQAALFLAGLAVALLASGCVARRSLELARAYTERQDYVSDEIYYVDTARRYLQHIFKININYYNYSNKTGDNYYNLEHPPLGKYIIATSMVLCGDTPLCWRLPGIVEAASLPIVLYLAWAARRPVRALNVAAGAISAAALASDRILYVDASVAMLDIHLAFFTGLSVALAVRRRYTSALVVAALASTVKMSGLAAVGGIMLLGIADALAKRRTRDIAWRIFESIIITVLVWVIVYLPLTLRFTPQDLVRETLAALRWHTTSRPEGPPTSTPPGWILNSNPFGFTYSGMLALAETTTIAEAAFLASAVWISLFIAYRSLRGRSIPWAPGSLVYVSTLLLYAAVYLMGNKTLYSFYAVQLSPPGALALAEAFHVLTSRAAIVATGEEYGR